MEIPDCTGAPVCSRCGPLSWLYSLRRSAWVAFVGDGDALRLHGCQSGQDRATWRDTYRGEPPSTEYVEAKSKIASKEQP